TTEAALREQVHRVENVPIRHADLARVLRDFNPDEILVFNWCEGLPGIAHSEALVPDVLDKMNFTYTGSTAEVIALSWDKDRAKRVLSRRGVLTPLWKTYRSLDVDDWADFPAIVKPAHEHCSFGLTPESVVTDHAELRRQVGRLLDTFGQPAVVEEFIDGREFHVSLIGNGMVKSLPPAEMDFTAFEEMRDRLCTYDSKFTPGSRHYNEIQLRLPPKLTEEESRRLTRIASAAYKAIGCRDYGRVDVRLRDGLFYVLDVNPNPDISSDTSLAAAAEAAGYSYGGILSRLVQLAALRHPKASSSLSAQPAA
ncbi:MAG: D-alanine--D-alanine ligase family protein, partial [Thermodesulfobacteriota bacterium]